MPKRPFCVDSEPVRVSAIELARSLVKHVSSETLDAVLLDAYQAAQASLGEERYNRYKSRLFFTRVVGELPEISARLSEALSDTAGSEGSEGFEPPEPSEPGPDLYADAVEVETFDDYKAVFSHYPYVWDMTSKGGERRLVLGTASGRDRNDILVRRNCAYTGLDGVERNHRDIQAGSGVLKRDQGNVRQTIKYIPYQPGAKVRFWTNVAGVGDRENLYVYVLLAEEGLFKVRSRVEFNDYTVGCSLPKGCIPLTPRGRIKR